jgi:hypothetical protein
MRVIGELSQCLFTKLSHYKFCPYIFTIRRSNTRNVVSIHRGNGSFVTSPVLYALFLMILSCRDPVLGNARNAGRQESKIYCKNYFLCGPRPAHC